MRTDFTYPEVGATRDDLLPAGYGIVGRDVVVASGRAAFERAADGLFRWQMHRRAGLGVRADTPPAAAGVVVVLRLPLGSTAPCRVVYTIKTEVKRGFAYGTLPGHPEQGEEAFLLEMTPGGDVRFVIRAFSRPRSVLARAGGPLTRRVQEWMTDRYVRAIAR
ncbi:DUF1990 family protein [Actinoplanes sp. HUAS TT8]|uniref:DUF1990 family protein n=1 Tax=Actinoplanes sp. HUAS TT8 TaxID=3447453 RepID=UPI003F51CE3C